MTAKCIALILGTSTTSAKRYLYGLKREGMTVDADLIGRLAQYTRNKQDLKKINDLSR
jgi:hypothetical protein